MTNPEGVGKEAREALELLDVTLPQCAEIQNPADKAFLMLVDTSTEVQAAKVLRDYAGAPLLLVDHHEVGSLARLSTVSLVISESPSCTEIMAALMARAGVRPSRSVATLAVLAILVETSALSRASATTFDALAYLLRSGGDYQWALGRVQKTLEEPVDLRMAKVKGASRLLASKVCNDIIVAVTDVGSYEADVAKALVVLGADVAVAIKDDRMSVRLSRRASARGVSAGALAELLGDELGGQGGGHRGAAGLKLSAETNNTEKLKQRVLSIIANHVARSCSRRER